MGKVWGFFVVGLLMTMGCGQVNREPNPVQDTYGGKCPGATGTTRVSKSGSFLISAGLKDGNKNLPQIGDNTYVIRLAHASDLQGFSESSQMKVTYWMPSMPEMGKSEEPGVRLADGTFTANLFFSMKGRWEVIVEMQDQQIKDEYVFEQSAH